MIDVKALILSGLKRHNSSSFSQISSAYSMTEENARLTVRALQIDGHPVVTLGNAVRYTKSLTELKQYKERLRLFIISAVKGKDSTGAEIARSLMAGTKKAIEKHGGKIDDKGAKRGHHDADNPRENESGETQECEENSQQKKQGSIFD